MADEVLIPQLVEEASLIPRVSNESMSRLDVAVQDIAQQAKTYECNSREDFVVGDAVVGRIRQLDKIFEGVYTPLKRFHDALKAKVLDEEKAKRKPLDEAKRTIGARMIAWEAAEKQKQAAILRHLQEEERKRAEDARLAQATALAEHAKRTNQPELAQKADALLDAPLDIAPVNIAPTTMVTGRSTKTVNRLEVEVVDLRQLLICVGASLLYEVADSTLKQLLKPYVRKGVMDILDAEDTRLRIAAPFTTWARNEARNRGEAFNVPGIKAGKTPGLG